jgi:N-acetylglucosaminyl-diphospho-decaprenol L-rhamnosyltransferase
MELSIVIVNWNSRQDLVNCVESLLRHPPSVSYEIIVVDSGSFDDVETALARICPTAAFIQSASNVGFGRANNLGVKTALGEYLLLLNPDTLVSRGAIDSLHRAARTLPCMGAVGPKLMNADGTPQDTCVRAFPTLLNQALESAVLRTLMPRSALWGARALHRPTSAPVAVEALSGACMMMRRDDFLGLRGFSEDYFMYSEDIDLCFRLSMKGLCCYFVPESSIVHFGGKSSSLSPVTQFAAIMMLESRRKYFARNRSTRYACAYRFTMLLNSAFRLAALFVLVPLLTLVGRRRQAIAAVGKWAAKLRWSIGLERWSTDFTPR